MLMKRLACFITCPGDDLSGGWLPLAKSRQSGRIGKRLKKGHSENRRNGMRTIQPEGGRRQLVRL